MTIQQDGMFTAGTFLWEDAESGPAWTAVCKWEYRTVRVKLIKRWGYGYNTGCRPESRGICSIRIQGSEK